MLLERQVGYSLKPYDHSLLNCCSLLEQIKLNLLCHSPFLFIFFFFFFKVHIKQTSKKHQRQLLPMVKHLRTDGPQPIVLTSDADSQRLAAGGRPGADGVRVTDG